jgi:hypothetical protein
MLIHDVVSANRRHVITRRISASAHWLHKTNEPQSSHYVAQEVQRELHRRN